MILKTPISALPKTSPLTIKRLESLDIKTYGDLLMLIPNRFEDYRKIVSIKELRNMLGEPLFEGIERHKLTITGRVSSFKNEYTRRGFKIQKAVLTDGMGSIRIAWFNQQYLATVMKPGALVQIAGYIKENGDFVPEEYDILQFAGQTGVNTGRIIPVYPEKRGLSSRTIRDKIAYVVRISEESVEEFIPESIVHNADLISEKDAIVKIHFPESEKDVIDARKRLSFDELFILQLSSAIIRKKWKEEVSGFRFQVSDFRQEIEQFIQSFPFNLTSAQIKSIDQILNDLSQKTPMNRLLQGDVGSGKTVVAAVAAFVAHLNGYKTLLMSPTEILAKQHFKTLQKLFAEAVLVTSSSKPKKEDLEKASIIVGTHALVSKKAVFSKVGLIIIDEQHKFGVSQRAMLKEKGINPHLLTMTATPIPRTVYLTLFGELSRSVIDELPKGRKTTKTYLVPGHKRNDSYEWIKKNISEEKAQIFIVCPLIEESEVETLKTIKAAKAEFERLTKVFSEYKLGLLHGKMKEKEKDEIMGQFAKGMLDILVSTPVVEVGVDIPNATIIVIEAAERFGLAQLHQLRGRVGRSDKQAYCLLFTEKTDDGVTTRLKNFAKITSGFELAEYDLKLRGVGQIYGTKQHGVIDLKIASLFDIPLVEKTHDAVSDFMQNYSLADYPLLAEKVSVYQTKLIARD